MEGWGAPPCIDVDQTHTGWLLLIGGTCWNLLEHAGTRWNIDIRGHSVCPPPYARTKHKPTQSHRNDSTHIPEHLVEITQVPWSTNSQNGCKLFLSVWCFYSGKTYNNIFLVFMHTSFRIKVIWLGNNIKKKNRGHITTAAGGFTIYFVRLPRVRGFL